MSHSKERAEKVCLNCNIPIHGRFCHQCGQENREPKESVWGLITHFFYDITHFDGSFFSTVKYLIFRPGFLSAEYIKGRRAGYLNPIRMYVFTSAFFFIIFFSVFNPDSIDLGKSDKLYSDSTRFNAMKYALQYADNKQDSALIMAQMASWQDSIATKKKRKASQNKRETILAGDTTRYTPVRVNMPDDYRSIAHYDSSQKLLPAAERDNWLKRMIQKRQILLNEKYKGDKIAIMKDWIVSFIHQFPKLLFVSLPIFALLLRLLYIRRKQFYYVDHGIFSIHLYIFAFLLLLVSMGVSSLAGATGWGWINWLQLVIWLYALYYNYKAMRNFYRQSRGKTIVKYLLLNILATISIIFLFAVFFVFT
ncbi:MAG: DUF3667 domain-containing protein, partial [Chitinophagaceae bacterium]